MKRNSTKLLLVPALAGIAFILTGAAVTASAQTPPLDSQAAAPHTQIFKEDQLTDLVAPIALYPDGLLSQVLVASTYPLEVVEAQQWLQRNRTLRGTQLTEAAKQQSWDPSVQALVAFPDVLSRLNQDIRWTRDLGDAFLAQEADVMATVQRLRASAQASGRLASTPQQTVSTEMQGEQAAIVIEPANPEVVYVPTYDPAYIWGPPDWGSYPSLYYPAYGYGWGPGIDLGFSDGWGWGPNWFGGTIFVDNNFFRRHGFHGDRDRDFNRGRGFNRAAWAHNPNHRLGIPYPNRQLAGRFHAASIASRANHNLNQSNGARNSFQGSANRSAMPGNPGNSQRFRGVSPRGGADRSFQTPQSRPMQSAPLNNPSFGGGMHGFGGGMRGFGGGGHSFGGGGHGFGGGGGHGGGGHR